MRNIVVDAGPMIAMFDRDDGYHARAREFLLRIGECRLFTTSLVVGEVAAMICDIQPNLFRFMEWLLAVVEIESHSCVTSRGRPNPRSEIMLRWMFEVPPAIAAASEFMY